MAYSSKLILVALTAFAVNVPFGYWRAGTRKFSPAWFVAVHGAVPVVAAVRILSGLGWHLATFPVLVAGYFGGQFAGSRLRRWKTSRRRGADGTSSEASLARSGIRSGSGSPESSPSGGDPPATR